LSGKGFDTPFPIDVRGYLNMAGTWYADKKLAGGGVIMDNGRPACYKCILYRPQSPRGFSA